MIGVVLVLLLLLAVAAVIALRAERRERLRRELLRADRQVGREYHRARRAMSEAAGQTWRNLADGGLDQ